MGSLNFQRTSRLGFMKEPEKNLWFGVGSLTGSLGFFKEPWLGVKTGVGVLITTKMALN